MSVNIPALFISHASDDDPFVRRLQQALADLRQSVWIDSRELHGGDALESAIFSAIEAAGAYAVLVSPASLQSKWVGKELSHALEVKIRKLQDGKNYPIIPLSLDGTRLGVLEKFFAEELIYIPVSSKPGGLAEAISAIRVALGLTFHPEYPDPPPQPLAPLEEWVLELTEPGFDEMDGKLCPKAKARLVYHPAEEGRREVRSKESWTFIAPLGSIETKEIRWYLEQYATWPGKAFQLRAATVERQLSVWGEALFTAALPAASASNVLQAWNSSDGTVERRFSVYVENCENKTASEDQRRLAREAATALLALPWELLREDGRFLFDGAKPVRVRRRLPNTRLLDVLATRPPVRILLVTARPDVEGCSYIDHRASAMPLVQATESLGEMLELVLLNPPTLPALKEELARARQAEQPYHVVHFDGHGIFSQQEGMGGLCFEDPRDQEKLENRRYQIVYTDKLGPALRNYRIPLVFLDACQTAQADLASGSVASDLLQNGVASVVAMTHSVLVETARRFVEAFYRRLTEGARVGEAMLAGQRALHDDTFRAQVFGVGKLHLQDWFVPVLYQEEDDPRLFDRLPTPQGVEITVELLRARLGALPPEPGTGFVGRSRELLALERLLFGKGARHAVISGNGGEGKTTLASELARWLVRTHRVQRAAFVSVERDGNAAAILNALLGQLVTNEKPMTATPDRLEPACLEIERVLRERSTLLLLDNMESLLPLSWLADTITKEGDQTAPDDSTLAIQTQSDLEAILKLCQRLNQIGDTRLLFTTRMAIAPPELYPSGRNTLSLRQMDREDAVRLVERVLRESSGLGDAERKAVENLVDSVQCHARSLALLAPSIEANGVERTQELLEELTARMHRLFPHSREQSLFASVELSLRRLSPERRNQARALAVFHGLVDLDLLGKMMEWTQEEALTLGDELAAVGLATTLPDHHLRLDPALCPYLRSGLEPQERDGLEKRWAMAMQALIETLYGAHLSKREWVNTLTSWELPNFVALLHYMDKTGDAEATVQLCTRLSTLVAFLGKPHLLKQIDRIQERAGSRLAGNWSHAHFEAQYMRANAALDAMRLPEAADLAGGLYRKTIAVGESAYVNADYDIAMAVANWSDVRRAEGAFDEALALLDEAVRRFQKIDKKMPGRGLEGMAASLTNQGSLLADLGHYAEAVIPFRQAINLFERGDYKKNIAQTKIRLAQALSKQNQHAKLYSLLKETRNDQAMTWQNQHDDASRRIEETKAKILTEILKLLDDAREISLQIGEPDGVVTAWYGIGQAYSNANKYDVASNDDKFGAAEHAYREALKTAVQNNLGTGYILIELGNIFNLQQRWEEAREVHQQASTEYHKVGNFANEGIALSNLANALYELGNNAQARSVANKALDLIKAYGNAAKPWNTWAILQDIETADGRSLEAAFAKNKAFESYLAYRRQGGETHTMVASICAQALDMIKADQAGGLMIMVNYWRNQPTWQEQGGQALLDALEAIAAGSRDPVLAENSSLRFVRAVEIVLLLEKLPPEEKTNLPKKSLLSTLFSRIIGKSQNSPAPIPDTDTKLRRTRIFQQREVITPVPAGWFFEEQANIGIQTVTMTHQSNEVKVLASFFPDPTGKMATRKGLEDLCRMGWEQHPERKTAVEKSMDIKFFKGQDGNTVWHSYTDSTLVGREIPPNQWLYVTSGLRSWKGAFVQFTILSNSKDSIEYRQALDLVTQGIIEASDSEN